MPNSLLQCIREEERQRQRRKRLHPHREDDTHHSPAQTSERSRAVHAAPQNAARVAALPTQAADDDDGLIRGGSEHGVSDKAAPSKDNCGIAAHAEEAESGSTAPAMANTTQPKQFYGSPRQTAMELSIQRFLHGVKHRLLLATSPQKAFELQSMAFDYADAHADEDLRIFAEEYSSKGARRFIASTYEHFWQYYRSMAPNKRHHYEVVRDGSPCHLYFDLEFPKASNADACGDSLVDQLMAAVEAAVQQQFSIGCEAASWIELDSSTDAKFSRHLVLRIPGAALHSNRDAGAFVAQLLAAAPTTFMLAKDEDGDGQTCFVDTSVYSRNRCFRLPFSSKFGKEATLKRSGRLQTAALSQQETFMQTLICNVPSGARLLRCSDDSVSTWSVVQQPQRRRSSNTVACRARQPPSPYPDVDALLASICCMGGMQGYVRTWTVMEGVDDVVLFSMANNRWCGNIGRQHKSNGIFYVVDLAAGEYRQRCFDPDCRDYRSEAMPLPPHCLRPSAGARADQEGVLADGSADDELDISAELAMADKLENQYRSRQASQH